MRKNNFLFFACLLLIGMSSAQGFGSFNLELGQLFPIMFITIVFVLLIYSFGHLTSNDQLVLQARSELTELIIFVIMFSAIIGFVTSGVATSMLGHLNEFIYDRLVGTSGSSLDSSFFHVSTAYSSYPVLHGAALTAIDKNKELIGSIFKKHLDYTREISILSTLQDTIGASLSSKPTYAIPQKNDLSQSKTTYSASLGNAPDAILQADPSASSSVSLSFCSGLGLGASLLNQVSNMGSAAFTGIFFQKALIEVLGSVNAVTAMLMIGFILRSIPFSRGAGAFFLAMGIGLYTILPFTVLLMNDLTYGFFSTTLPYLNAYGTGVQFSNYVQNTYSSISFDGDPMEALLGPVCTMGEVKEYLRNIAEESSGGTFDFIISLPFMVLLAQALALLGFVSIVGGISKIFGAEISPYVIGRLVQYLK